MEFATRLARFCNFLAMSDNAKPRDPVRVTKEETLGKQPSVSRTLTPPPALAIALNTSAVSGSASPVTRSKVKPTYRPSTSRASSMHSPVSPIKMLTYGLHVPFPNHPRLLRYHVRPRT